MSYKSLLISLLMVCAFQAHAMEPQPKKQKTATVAVGQMINLRTKDNQTLTVPADIAKLSPLLSKEIDKQHLNIQVNVNYVQLKNVIDTLKILQKYCRHKNMQLSMDVNQMKVNDIGDFVNIFDLQHNSVRVLLHDNAAIIEAINYLELPLLSEIMKARYHKEINPVSFQLRYTIKDLYNHQMRYARANNPALPYIAELVEKKYFASPVNDKAHPLYNEETDWSGILIVDYISQPNLYLENGTIVLTNKLSKQREAVITPQGDIDLSKFLENTENLLRGIVDQKLEKILLYNTNSMCVIEIKTGILIRQYSFHDTGRNAPEFAFSPNGEWVTLVEKNDQKSYVRFMRLGTTHERVFEGDKFHWSDSNYCLITHPNGTHCMIFNPEDESILIKKFFNKSKKSSSRYVISVVDKNDNNHEYVAAFDIPRFSWRLFCLWDIGMGSAVKDYLANKIEAEELLVIQKIVALKKQHKVCELSPIEQHIFNNLAQDNPKIGDAIRSVLR